MRAKNKRPAHRANYNRVQRQVYLFLDRDITRDSLHQPLSHTLQSQTVPRNSPLSAQRSELAQKLISTQESTLAPHLAANCTTSSGRFSPRRRRMLTRAGKQAPEGSALRADLREVCEIAQTTLDKVRKSFAGLGTP